MHETPLVLVERYGARGELVLNRPEKRNALTGPLVEQLIAGLAELVSDPSVHVILIRGAGGTFCAGRDRDAFAAEPPQPWVATFSRRTAELHTSLYHCPKVTVGVLEQAAIAAGSALALACDVLIAGDAARFHVAEVGMGMPAAINIVWLELKYGVARAIEFAACGQPYTGSELAARGLALRSVPDARVLVEARTYADDLTRNGPAAVATAKQMIRALGGEADFGARVERAQRMARAAR